MKSLTKLLVIALFFPLNALVAQSSFFIGANGGTNFSKFKHTIDLAELYSTSSSLSGLNGGVEFGLQLSNWTITSGVNYMQKGGNYATDNFSDQNGVGFLSAKERLHYVSIPVLVGYRAPISDNFGFSLDMGPAFNMGFSGKIDENIEYYASEEVTNEQYSVDFGTGVNDDYKSTQVSFQFSPGMYFKLNNRSTITFNFTWDNDFRDAFNQRYKQANTFFDDYKGSQFNRSTVLTIGYEYHINFSDKY